MRTLIAAGLVWGVLLAAVAQAQEAVPDAPQAPLPRSGLTIETQHGPVRFTVELATDRESQARGLMFRTALAANAGMLFDFRHLVMANFWMKNTLLPLDIIFIRSNGRISTIYARAKPYSETLISSAEPIRAVLEINGGRAQALGIQPGDLVRHWIFGDR